MQYKVIIESVERNVGAESVENRWEATEGGESGGRPSRLVAVSVG